MNFRLIAKVAAVFFVCLLLLIPIAQVASLVREREGIRDQVVMDMAKSAGYSQTVTGPVLVVPYEKIVRTYTEETKEKPRQILEQLQSGQLVFLPTDFNGEGSLNIEERSRGIYKARVFSLDSSITSTFVVPPHYGIKEALADYTFKAPFLAVGISDVRGIGSGLSLEVGGQSLPLEPGTAPPGEATVSSLGNTLGSGVHAALPKPDSRESPSSIAVRLHLSLQGTGELRLLPTGKSSKMALRSNWPHPSFIGEFLPRSREIHQDGFKAAWETSFFATNLEGTVERCSRDTTGAACREVEQKAFGVSLVDPVDHYMKSERATKYAFLFIGLTFAMFFLLEVIRRTSVHPIQYGLVGLALAVFFLLLLSLSEHIGFSKAYVTSAAATVLLVTYYVFPLLGKLSHAGGFGGIVASLYAVLYGILSSEDYALLTGSLVVLLVLGLVMVATRRVNWSKFGLSGEMSPPAASLTETPSP